MREAEHQKKGVYFLDSQSHHHRNGQEMGYIWGFFPIFSISERIENENLFKKRIKKTRKTYENLIFVPNTIISRMLSFPFFFCFLLCFSHPSQRIKMTIRKSVRMGVALSPSRHTLQCLRVQVRIPHSIHPYWCG